MPRTKGRKPDIYRIDVLPETYRYACALSAQSRIPIDQLIRMGLSLLDASTRTVHAMHPPRTTQKPQSERIRDTLRRQEQPTANAPAQIGAIIAGLARTERRQPR